METIVMHPEGTSTIATNNVLDLGKFSSRIGARSIQLSDGYKGKILSLVPKTPLGSIDYHGVQVIKKSRVLSEEIQGLSKDISFILNPPAYQSPEERLSYQKINMEYAHELLANTLPQKIQAGAMADSDVIIHGKIQNESQLFYHKLDEALMCALEGSISDSQASESIMWIFRTMYSLPMEEFEDIFQITNEREKINEWRQLLSCITMGEADKYTALGSKSPIGESSFSREEYSHLSRKVISREFARRVSSIFEIFVDKYVKTLWAQEAMK